MGKNLLKAVVLSSLVLSGCDNCAPSKIDTKDLKIENLEKGPEMVDYVAETPLYTGTNSPSTIVGDFNEDGHLDFIVTGNTLGSNSSAQSFLYEGDGKGNFKLRQYEKK